MPICFLGILLYWWQACLAIIHLFTFLKSCFWCWQINEIHEQFIIALRDLFERYKEITGYSGLHLRVLWHSSTTPKICNNMALLLLPQLNCQTGLRKHSGRSCVIVVMVIGLLDLMPKHALFAHDSQSLVGWEQYQIMQELQISSQTINLYFI